MVWRLTCPLHSKKSPMLPEETHVGLKTSVHPEYISRAVHATCSCLELQLQLIWEQTSVLSNWLEFWPPASLWITEPQLVYLLPCWHPRRAFPGTDIWTAHLRWWVVLKPSCLGNVVKFTVVPLAILSAISEVNFCPADSAEHTLLGAMDK